MEELTSALVDKAFIKTFQPTLTPQCRIVRAIAHRNHQPPAAAIHLVAPELKQKQTANPTTVGTWFSHKAYQKLMSKYRTYSSKVFCLNTKT